MSSIVSTWYSFTACCFPNPIIKLNKRVFKVIKLLGEGGFSFVYLVEDTSTHKLYALKKIRCPFGSENVKDAMREVEMYKLFQHENIIKVVDTCTVQDKDGSKVVYIFLPYYKNGNLQEAITNGTNFSEKEILKLFKGICYAVRALHTYKFSSVPVKTRNGNHFNVNDNDGNNNINGDPLTPSLRENNYHHNNYNNNRYQEEDEEEIDGVLPFAHRDIKPGNILLSDDMETPILMDFGSLVRARIKIASRSQALLQKELAEQHSTMPYRAPELFDVKTNTELDEKVDIWSLGCTLYAMAYGQSPFEASMNEQGGSIALAVLDAKLKFPDKDYSEGLKDLIKQMLIGEPKDRPNIHKVIESVDMLHEQAD